MSDSPHRVNRPMQRGRVALIGDVGGHADELENALDDLGVDVDTGTMPEDLTVVQVGDLVDRGPDSARVVEIVDRCSTTVQWVQLVGNHEGAHCGGPRFTEADKLDLHTVMRVSAWWPDRMVAAATVDTPDGSLLVTHAGLTAGFWHQIGRPPSAMTAACILNDRDAVRVDDLFRPGCLIQGEPVRFDAGPVWAEAARELYPSLLAAGEASNPVPFGQVHGHSSPYNFRDRQWRNPRLAEYLTIDKAARQTHGTVGGQRLHGIDPALGRYAGVTWKPLVFENAIVTEPNIWGAIGACLEVMDEADFPDLAPVNARCLILRLGVHRQPRHIQQAAISRWLANPDVPYQPHLLVSLQQRGYDTDSAAAR